MKTALAALAALTLAAFPHGTAGASLRSSVDTGSWGDCPGLTCLHQSQPNAACSGCVGCQAPFWTGQFCNTFNSSVSPDQVTQYMQGYVAQSTASAAQNVQYWASSATPLIPGWRSFGFTYDRTTLSLIPTYPIVNIAASQTQWTTINGTTYSEVAQAQLTPVDPYGGSPPTVVCNVFTTVSEYFAWMTSFTAQSQGSPALLFKQPQGFMNDVTLAKKVGSICVATYTTYNLAQAPNPTASQFATDFIFGQIPATFSPQTSAAFTSLFQAIGTDYLSQVSMGGIAVMAITHPRCLLYQITADSLLQGVNQIFSNLLNDQPWSNGVDPHIVKQTQTPPSFYLRQGGDPAVSSTVQWSTTIPNAPAPVFWTYSPITDLIDPTVYGPEKDAFSAAVTQYISAYEQNLVAEIQSAMQATNAFVLNPLPVTMGLTYPGSLDCNGGTLPAAGLTQVVTLAVGASATESVQSSTKPIECEKMFFFEPDVVQTKCTRGADNMITASIAEGPLFGYIADSMSNCGPGNPVPMGQCATTNSACQIVLTYNPANDDLVATHSNGTDPRRTSLKTMGMVGVCCLDAGLAAISYTNIVPAMCAFPNNS